MRAFVIRGPHDARVEEVEPPDPGEGQVVVAVERAGICGTDIELYTGEMAYLHDGHARYPLRVGHEWVGRVSALGGGVPRQWLGRRVTGDTMIGCGTCHRCTTGRHHVCEDRYEVGVRGGWPGALAEQLVMPIDSLFPVPDSITASAGALIEPGANAVRAVEAAALEKGDQVLIFGAGTIGLLCAQIAAAQGADVHIIGRRPESIALAQRVGIWGARLSSHLEEIRGAKFGAVIDATNDPAIPSATLDWVEPAGRVVFVGLAGRPSLVDTRTIALNDVTAVGILGGSSGIEETIRLYETKRVNPDDLVAEVVGLDDVVAVFDGRRAGGEGLGTKTLVDPRS